MSPDAMTTNEGTNAVAARRKLDEFLVDNEELERLNARLAEFNLFRVLKIEEAEIRHSNVLAWLLTPGETHGLGANFLRRFLSRLLIENDTIDVNLTPAQVELMRFDDVEVLREWQNIDIVARSRTGSWCLLIENKIRSRESRSQLSRYMNLLRNEEPRLEVIPVFLTLEGEDPSQQGQEAGFIALSHVHVLDVAERIVNQYRSHIPNAASVFLDHYLTTLRSLTMQDDELVELCKTIYRKHRDAVDLIVEYGASSQVIDACESKIKELVDVEFAVSTGNRVWFVPKKMAELQQEICTGWTWLPRRLPVACWFYYAKRTRGAIRFAIEVGPVSDPDVRLRLLRALKKKGFSFREKALRKEAKFTRILSKSQKLRTDEDGQPDEGFEYVQEVATSLWKKAWEEAGKIIDVLRSFDWETKETEVSA